MPVYDATRFDPPAPVADVTLRNPDTGAIWPGVPMLIDSGADVTLIPQSAVTHLDLAADPARQYELIGFDGSISFAPVVRLELVYGRLTFRGRFLLIDQSCGILGRNILNALSLLLDGPNLTWEERQG